MAVRESVQIAESRSMQTGTSPSTRKQVATSFLKLAASGNVDEAYDKRHVSPNFRHHNPFFPGDAASLKAGMAEAAQRFPHRSLEVQHVLEDGDVVAVHSRVQHGTDEPAVAVVHLFRFEGDQIVELWDIGQAAPEDSPNQNGMF